MKVIGIIAEYNPFHNGHAYQIKKIREEMGADYIVIAMSGDFVQRGAPAVINKYARTQMALACGADLVIELPALWACSSAERFATAGCTLLEKAGCIDGLCFGVETDNFSLLSAAAEVLSDEPEDFSRLLLDSIKKGLPYPAAREEALLKSLSSRPFSVRETVKELLGSPNNILAIEYLKAIKKRNLSLTPFPLKRKGADYHSMDICTPNASATAIRALLSRADSDFFKADQNNAICSATAAAHMGESADALKHAMPPGAFSVLRNYLSASPFLTVDDFSSVLNYLLFLYSNTRKDDNSILSCFADSNEAIANRILKNIFCFQSFSQFCELNKSRDITYTRISRVLLHIILNFTSDDYKKGASLDYIPYLRILGFQKASAPLLTKLKRSAAVPVISKLADASGILEKESLWLLERDIFASEVYEQTKYGKLYGRQNLPSNKEPVPTGDIKKRTAPKSEYANGIVLL